MKIQLVINYDAATDTCQVGGIPVGELPTGEKKAVKGLCFSALEWAKKVVHDFDPNATNNPSPIAIATVMPPLPRSNGRG